jgi:dolichyl-phosphate-mannose-protein mannosyltransferase
MPSSTTAQPRERRARRALVTAVFLVSAALRLTAVDRPLNIDEALWIRRGGTFVAALARGDLSATYTRPHPGVTTMWLVGLSNVGWCATAGDKSWQSCAQGLANDPLPPLSAYVVPRRVQALVTAGLLALMAHLSVQWLGFRPAALGCALLAFEPFFLGYQRFITTDALATDLGAVAALSFLLYLREGHCRRLVFSGLAFGLAVATKVPALLLAAPLLISVVAVERARWPGFPARGFRKRALELTVWAAVGLAAVVAIWPVLWVRPIGMLGQLQVELGSETRANAFRSDDTGWDFYLRILAWRFTPLMQAGALICGAALLWPAWRRRLPQRVELEGLAALGVVTLVLLRLAGTAGSDRYLLPVVPFLALLAGAGWDLVRDRVAARWPVPAAPLVPAAVVVGQLAMLVPHLPEGITFYNPLLGGPAAASHVLAIGQGEGLERAARYIDAEPGAASRVAAAPGFASALAPYFRGRTIDVTPGDEWLAADRVVLYIRAVQTGSPDPVLVTYLASWPQPLYTVRRHGLDYARVYAGPIVVPPELSSPTSR